MRNPIATPLAAALLSAPLLAGPAAADIFERLDADRSGGIDRGEFSAMLDEADVYAEWDTDRDGWLTDEELNTGLGDAVVYDDASSRIWDLNDGNTELDEETFGTRYFEAHDADEDGRLDEAEWRALERDARERGWLGS